MTVRAELGVVVIGRNEGERLRRCLASLPRNGTAVVYVDSGSVDGSPGLAREMGFDVVELEASAPFTAARARNAGLARLLERYPDMAYVQFIDGDCELNDGWLARGAAELEARPDVAVVFGHLSERDPGTSVYNRLCDIEWKTTLGGAADCGGVALMRVAWVHVAGGFDPRIIAAEDTEFCSRLRARGGRIMHVDHEMALHDAAILGFGQWWWRCVRAGHAYAEFSAARVGAAPALFARQYRSVLAWAVLLPLTIVALALPTGGLSLALFVGYPLHAAWIYWRLRRRLTDGDAILYAGQCVLAKFPQLAGIVWYYANRLRRRQTAIIEHKTRSVAPNGRRDCVSGKASTVGGCGHAE